MAATEPPDGIVSPGGVGYDINCGVRLLALPQAGEHLGLLEPGAGVIRLRELATRRLQLADEDQIAQSFPSFEVGALPPFGPIVPAAEVIDIGLTQHERILCPAGDHRHSVLIDPHDVVRITEARTADICED